MQHQNLTYNNTIPTERKKELELLLSLPNNLITKLVTKCIQKFEAPTNINLNKSTALSTLAYSLDSLAKNNFTDTSLQNTSLSSYNKEMKTYLNDVPSLSDSSKNKIMDKILLRLIKHEFKNKKLQSTILIKLITLDSLSDNIINSITDMMINKSYDNYDLTLRLLYLLYYKSNNQSLYKNLLKQTIDNILENINNINNNIIDFFIYVPQISNEVYDNIYKQINIINIEYILKILRDIVKYKISERLIVMSYILKLAFHEEKTMRSMAIRIIIHHFINNVNLKEHIIKEVKTKMKDVLKPPSIAKLIKIDQDKILNTSNDLFKDYEKNKDKLSDVEKKIILTEENLEILKIKELKDNFIRNVKENVKSYNKKEYKEYKKSKMESYGIHVQKNCLLFFAICTKYSEILKYIVDIYVKCEKVKIKDKIKEELTELIEILGINSSHLHEIISNTVPGSEDLTLHILLILTKNKKPTNELINITKDLYHKKIKDLRFIIPILSELSKTDIYYFLPKLMKVPLKLLELAIMRIIKKENNNNNISPNSLLVFLHEICDSREYEYIKKTIALISLCLNDKEVFNSEVVANVLQRLVRKSKLPILVMRTILQSLLLFPTLKGFIINILKKLINRKIWSNKDLLNGFVKCCEISLPDSIDVIFLLRKEELIKCLRSSSNLMKELKKFINNTTDVKSSFKKMILEIDGKINVDNDKNSISLSNKRKRI